MHVFYINLSSRPDRRAFMEDQFSAIGVAAERVEAATPETLTAAERRLYDAHAGRHMTPIEASCNFSHMRIWREIVARNLPRALILEDDVVLSRSLPTFLAAADAMPTPPPVIRVETLNLPLRAFPPEATLPPGIGLRRVIHRDAGSAGYIVSLEAAALLADRPELTSMLVDAVLFNPFIGLARYLGVRYADPGLAIQLYWAGQREAGVGTSDLVGQRSARRRGNPALKFARKAASWITYDARAAWTLFATGASRLAPRAIPFKPD